jgi:hypothetical protein
MKKSLFLILIISLLTAGLSVSGQKGGLLKKVTKSMTNELLGKPAGATNNTNKNSNQPEPSCACDQPEVAMDMGGKLQLDYTELNISMSDDGRILAKMRYSEDYYIVQNGITTGPVKPGDSRLKGFNIEQPDDTKEKSAWDNNEYISKSGDKFLITFGGKTYGPYAMISHFVVTKSKDRFAAMVIENLVITDDQGKKMDQAIKNAKTEQEKMDLAMQYTQQMQQKIMQAGGAAGISPKLITNIPNATWDIQKSAGGSLNGNIKYDDILLISYDKVINLQMKVVFMLKPEAIGNQYLFVNTDNTKYAYYTYGTLNFSDNSNTISELFNPHLIKINGQVYLAYMYYSPKKNAIMQCKIPF